MKCSWHHGDDDADYRNAVAQRASLLGVLAPERQENPENRGCVTKTTLTGHPARLSLVKVPSLNASATCATPTGGAHRLSAGARSSSAHEPSKHARVRSHDRPSHDARQPHGVPSLRARDVLLPSCVRRVPWNHLGEMSFCCSRDPYSGSINEMSFRVLRFRAKTVLLVVLSTLLNGRLVPKLPPKVRYLPLRAH